MDEIQGQIDRTRPWFHGSPLELTELSVASTITQDRRLARVFSHKPTLVAQGDDGAVQHNGRGGGWLYVVAEPVGPEDVTPVPGSTMGPGQEWHTTRPLRVTLVERTTVRPEEHLTLAGEAEVRRRARDQGA